MVTQHTHNGLGMAIKRKKKNKQIKKKMILRKKVVNKIKEELTDEEIKERNADKILPRVPDTFVTKDAILPSSIIEKRWKDLTPYEQKLYFDDKGNLEPTNEEGQPRNRNNAKYKKLADPAFAKNAMAKGDHKHIPKTGRPKNSFSLTSILKALIRKPSAHDQDKTVARVILEVALDKAQRGDYAFFREIYNRLEGKVPDKLQMSDPGKAAREAQTVLEQLMEQGFSEEESAA